MSTVIKAGKAGHILNHLSTVDLADHLAEARAVIAEARRTASRITAQAKRDAERGLAEAHREGYRVGHEKGHAEGIQAGETKALVETTARFDKEQASLVESMKAAVKAVDVIKHDLHIEAEQNLLALSVQVARKLTFDIGRLHRDAAAANLERALRLVGSKTDLTIRFHPDDVETMRRFADSIVDRVNGSEGVTLEPDETLAPGGCVVGSSRCNVDASLETQVQELVSVLLKTAVTHE